MFGILHPTVKAIWVYKAIQQRQFLTATDIVLLDVIMVLDMADHDILLTRLSMLHEAVGQLFEVALLFPGQAGKEDGHWLEQHSLDIF